MCVCRGAICGGPEQKDASRLLILAVEERVEVVMSVWSSNGDVGVVNHVLNFPQTRGDRTEHGGLGMVGQMLEVGDVGRQGGVQVEGLDERIHRGGCFWRWKTEWMCPRFECLGTWEGERKKRKEGN